MKELIYQGSVKNLFKLGSDVLFEYSDRYSLFDWGEMPDHLENKGECLALMGSLFFRAISTHGINHHFLSLADAEGNEIPFTPSRFMKVKNVSVTRPSFTNGKYDYQFYKTKPQEGLVPLEVIFRFGLGKGSSLTKRIKANPELLQQWNVAALPENVLLDEPIIDFSTKLEKGDRYLSFTEAKSIAGLTDAEFESLIQETKRVANFIKMLTADLGVELWDGKVEWAFTAGTERGFMLVDSIGLDELRLVKDGVSLSKEFLREHYRRTPWFTKLEDAKAQAQKQNIDFKTLFTEEPPKLPLNVKRKAESLYLSFTNDLSQVILGKKLFDPKFTLKNWVVEE
jgi:phosphoribosylaminoimidazole-succinocarboxamide synthase